MRRTLPDLQYSTRRCVPRGRSRRRRPVERPTDTRRCDRRVHRRSNQLPHAKQRAYYRRRHATAIDFDSVGPNLRIITLSYASPSASSIVPPRTVYFPTPSQSKSWQCPPETSSPRKGNSSVTPSGETVDVPPLPGGKDSKDRWPQVNHPADTTKGFRSSQATAW